MNNNPNGHSSSAWLWALTFYRIPRIASHMKNSVSSICQMWSGCSPLVRHMISSLSATQRPWSSTPSATPSLHLRPLQSIRFRCHSPSTYSIPPELPLRARIIPPSSTQSIYLSLTSFQSTKPHPAKKSSSCSYHPISLNFATVHCAIAS